MILAALALLADAGAPALPSLAERNLDAARDGYADCIVTTARRYARGAESAEAIAEATLSACSELEDQVREAVLAHLAENRVGGTTAQQAWHSTLKPDLQASARQSAIRTVIEARLPPPAKKRNKTI